MSVSKAAILAVAADVKENEPMSGRTTFRAGGNAKYFVTAQHLAELKNLLSLLRAENEKYFLLGAGSNVLFASDVYDGVVIALGGGFRQISRNGVSVTAGAAARMGALEAFAVKEGLSGLEPLSGIPGTVGGAATGNAGANGVAVADIFESADVLDDNLEAKSIPKSGAEFFYRGSSLSPFTVLAATFLLKPDKPSEILKRIDGVMSRRVASQPHLPSAGSVFKNPRGAAPAGKLIEDCGLKGEKIGGAMISNEHANFIVNAGKATAADILALMDTATAKVKEKFGVSLEPEIKVVK